jgi:CP family cyanate transporter-like MFS transporter
MAMTLCVGYLVAAAGPWLLGAVHDAAGDWSAPLVVLIAITLAELIPGLPAARPRTIARGES